MEKSTQTSVFDVLNKIDVGKHIEKKNGLSYLSWAWAWSEVKKAFPDAAYTVYENAELGGMPYFTDGRTCMVKTGVTINQQEYIEYLPVMDYRNQSIPQDKVTSFDVNKAIQRSLTKACARHGLGLYIYAGEDLPENLEGEQKIKHAVSSEEIEPEEMNSAIKQIKSAVTYKELAAIYKNSSINLRSNERFVAALSARRKVVEK